MQRYTGYPSHSALAPKRAGAGGIKLGPHVVSAPQINVIEEV